MPEHWCKDCKNDGDNTCKFTGAVHTTGIECPSFGPKEKETQMFKIGDKVRIVSDDLGRSPVGDIVEVTRVDTSCLTKYPYMVDGQWWLGECELELVEEPKRTFVGHPKGVLEIKVDPADPCGGSTAVRVFDSGATRDTTEGKLDYTKALSPIVLRRYVQYLDKHRLQPDGSYRDFDNWKQGIPQEAYISGGGRHFMDTWLLTEGYATEDNHGPVELEDAICAQLFNLMGRLHEMLKVKTTTTRPGGAIEAPRTAPTEKVKIMEKW